MLALDVVNTREGTNIDMYVFWQVVYMSSLFMCTCVIPFAYFFYESDEDKSYKERFCIAFRNNLILLIAFVIVHFPMFVSLRHAYIPIENKTYMGLEDATPERKTALMTSVFLTIESEDVALADKTIYNQGNTTVDMQLTFAQYTIGAGAFWGHFLLVFFLGTGLISIPFTNIFTWLDQPKPMNESQFKKEKDELARKVDFLLKDGRKIYDDKI